jgi:hypothetical protein
MINLLPPDGKKALRTEYYLRVATTYSFLVGIALAITAALLLPTYFYVRFQSAALSASAAAEGREAETFAAIERAVTEANALSELYNESPRYVPLSEIVAELTSLSGRGVTLQSFTLGRSGETFPTFTIVGTAENRNALVEFRNRVEAHEYFASVDLPLSTLARDVNIPFQVNVTPAAVIVNPL